MARILEHNVGDFTAILEAGVPLLEAQAAFAAEGQMLALDPPLGADDAATIGGVVAANDSGPLRHRYGGVRDLVVGITVVLSDGTVARSGGKVIKNVAGYDLGKLFAGSSGTLGLIARLAVRLHPAPQATATAVASGDDPARLAAAAAALAAPAARGRRARRRLGRGLRPRARALQRRDGGRPRSRGGRAGRGPRGRDRRRRRRAVGAPPRAPALRGRDRGQGVRAARPTCRALLEAARSHGATVVSRAALGLSWVALPAGGDVAALRSALAPRACTVLDGADRVQDPWPPVDPGVLAVMERIKARFDPARAFRPGAFVGGL